MKKIMSAKVAGILFLALVLFFCRPQEKEKTDQEASYGATPVKVMKVTKQRISEKLFYTGVLDAWKKINITPDIGGKITQIYVDEGEKVQAGQLLAELDTRAIRLQAEQAKAVVAVADASYKDAKRNLDRMERLRVEDAVSDQQLEKVRLACEAAEAQLQQARAALNLAEHNLDVSLMKAPFSGVVASRNADVGDVINPMMGGFSPTSGVLTLMNFSRIKIHVDVSQPDVRRIQKAQTALLKVSAFPERVFPARVTLVNQTADAISKKFKVELMVDNPDLLLRPNTFGEIIFEVSTMEAALVVPQKAVSDNSFIFLARGNQAVKREVTLGIQNSEGVAVLSGLVEGDLVIVEGNYGLEDGSLIEIKEVLK